MSFFTTFLSRTTKVGLATLVAVSSLLVITITPAFAAVKTWTGTAGDNKFSTSGNWTGGVPTNGDSITFNETNLVAHVNVTNDLTDLSLVGISFTGMNGASREHKIVGNPITISGSISSDQGYGSVLTDIKLSGDTTVTDIQALGNYEGTTTIDTQGHVLNFVAASKVCMIGVYSSLVGSSAVNSSGQVNFTKASPSYTGAITVNSGTLGLIVPDTAGNASQITVNDGASIFIGLNEADRTLAVPLKLVGSGANGDAKLSANVFAGSLYCAGGAGPIPATKTLTLSGGVELLSDALFTGNYANVRITGGYTPNGHSFIAEQSSIGTLTLPNGEIVDAINVEVTYNENKPTEYLNIQPNSTAKVSGTYGDSYVSDRAFIKGTGTVKSLTVVGGGTVAPGNSPGKLTILESFNLAAGAKYEAEIQNKDLYDQLQVGTTVTLDPASVLNVKLFGQYDVKAGDTFTIINKTGPGAVDGTFNGLAEGATFQLNNGVFKISYVGGDGNDVVLTVVTAPSAPDTGFAFIANNPVVTLIATMFAAGVILLVAKRQTAPVRKTRR